MRLFTNSERRNKKEVKDKKGDKKFDICELYLDEVSEEETKKKKNINNRTTRTF